MTRRESKVSATGLRLLQQSRTPEQVEAALEAIAPGDDQLRAAIVNRFHRAAEHPSEDGGAAIRTVLIKALRPLMHKEDSGLLEKALWTYEFSWPGPEEVAGGLRAAALVALSDVDSTLAGFHAARLLSDRHRSPFSGEPAVTAARVLSELGQALVLYGNAARGDAGEVMAECLRGLAHAPSSLVSRLIDDQISSDDEIVLLGVIDLLIKHDDRQTFTPLLVRFLMGVGKIDVYRYGVAAMFAARREDLITELKSMLKAERRSEYGRILRETLEPDADRAQ